MANHASALKRQRQNEKRRTRNRGVRSKLHTLIKKVKVSTKKEEALNFLKAAIKAIDKAAQKGVLHGNNAGRKISRLTSWVNKLAAF